MSSLVRSFASLYCRKLRCTTRLGRSDLPTGADGPRRSTCREYASMSGTRRPVAPPPFFTWARLAIGSIVAVAAPFVHSKWAAPFVRISSEVEAVEQAAEVVEEVAAAAEKVSAEVAEQLQEDAGLRRAAVLVQQVSKEVAAEAHLARDILHKVEEIEEDVKAMIVVDVDGKKAQHMSSKQN